MNHVIPAKAGTHSNSGIWLGTEMDPRLRGDDRSNQWGQRLMALSEALNPGTSSPLNHLYSKKA